MARPIVTRIANKFLIAVPPQFRDIFDLQEGDLFEWRLDESAGEIRILPKRAQLIVPRTREHVREMRKRSQESQVHDAVAENR
jgi:hypothetical protein